MKTITIAGNVGQDARLKTLDSGDSVLNFSVAVEDRQGREKKTLWFDCAMWGKRADSVAQYVTKGSKVAVSGDLSTREHEGKTYLTVRVAELTLQGGKTDAAPSYGAGSPPTAFPDDDNDIPFCTSEGIF